MRFLSIVPVIILVACNSQPRSERGRSVTDTRRPDTTDGQSLVGRRLPLPPEYKRVASMVLGEARSSHFGMQHLLHGDLHILILDSVTSRDPTGSPQWVVLSALVLPSVGANESVALEDCSLDGNADASIVAIGTWGAQRPTVRYATRPDPSSRRFERLPPQRVSCAYDEDRN
jgi:hypothetical protein